ncbi:MAG: AsmA family protein [Burkholderiales bacterium]|nr:AsmA family protein [Burkholderiales bacterium]
MTPASKSRWRIAAWPLGIVAAALIGVVVCETQGWPFLKGPVQQQLSKRLQRPVEFGDTFKLKLFGSIRVDTSSLRIGPPDGLAADSLLSGDLVNAKSAHLELPYATLRQLARKDNTEAPRIASLRFGEVDASLKRLADGHSNWAFAPTQAAATQRQFDLPTVDELVVEHGHVAFDDAVLKTSFAAKVSTSEGDRASVQNGQAAGLVVEGRGNHEKLPFQFRVTSAGVLPLVARDTATAVPITIRLSGGSEAKFTFDGTGTDVLSFQAIDGTATLSGPSLAKVGDALGITLPTTERFTLKGRLSKSGQRWAFKNADLDVGDSHLGGNFSYDRAPQVPMLTGELNGSHLVLADLLPAFGAPKPGTEKAKAHVVAQGGRVLPDRELDIPSLRWMNANVKVRLTRAELGTLFRQPLAPLDGDLTLDGGVLRLSNLLARAAGGEVKGNLGLDGTQANPLWTANVRWAGIELDQWLRPRNKTSQQPKPSGENPGYVTGRLGGHAQLQAHGRSTAKMIASTDGTVQAWVRDGTISHLIVEAAGIDIAQGLGLLIVGDDPLPMNCAVVKANAKAGLLTPEAAMVDTRDSTLLITGSVNLADERLALVMTSKPKDMSPATLRSPVRLEGTFDHPQVYLEKKPIGLKVLASAALAMVHPLAALIPLFDPGDKDGAGGCQRTLQHLRDADGPAGVRDAKAPKANDKSLPPDPAARHAAASAPMRK